MSSPPRDRSVPRYVFDRPAVLPPEKAPGRQRLDVLRLEEGQERRVLRQEMLDLGDAGACPVLDPGLGQIVRDVVETALAHDLMIDTGRGGRHGPFGSTWGSRRPTA